jgi:cytochrome c biogenesis protein CcmG, thiol:disulfide interchange protein DsbE
VTRRRLVIAAILAVVGAVVITGAILGRDTEPATAVPFTGSADQVEFRGADIDSGDEVSLARFAGRPVVIVIWASWCPGCNAEARALARFARAHPEAGFIGVNFSDTRDAARSFYRQYGWRFPSVFDPDGRIASELGLQGTPTTIFLDAEHREVARIVGETDEAGFADGFAKASAGV